jgi:hypothetical protein
MRIIYRGGYDKLDEESVKESVIYGYQQLVKKAVGQGKKVAFVTLAKPDGYYDERLRKAHGREIEIIGWKKRHRVNWWQYDLIFLLGGDTRELHKGLVESGFSLNVLKTNVLLVGDSAGAYLLAAGYFDVTTGPAGEEKTNYHPGLYPQSQITVVAHVNRIDPQRLKKIRESTNKKRVKLLELEENQEKLLDKDGKLIDVDKKILLTVF